MVAVWQLELFVPIMPVKVKLAAVADELEFLTDEARTYLKVETGEFFVVTDELRRKAEEWEEGDDVPYRWIEDAWPDICRIVRCGDGYVRLPSKFDVHEWQIMEKFANSRGNPREYEDLHYALRGRGAFRHFKDKVYRMGIENEWFAFRHDALLRIAREWCENFGIPYE